MELEQGCKYRLQRLNFEKKTWFNIGHDSSQHRLERLCKYDNWNSYRIIKTKTGAVVYRKYKVSYLRYLESLEANKPSDDWKKTKGILAEYVGE